MAPPPERERVFVSAKPNGSRSQEEPYLELPRNNRRTMAETHVSSRVVSPRSRSTDTLQHSQQQPAEKLGQLVREGNTCKDSERTQTTTRPTKRMAGGRKVYATYALSSNVAKHTYPSVDAVWWIGRHSGQTPRLAPEFVQMRRRELRRRLVKEASQQGRGPSERSQLPSSERN